MRTGDRLGNTIHLKENAAGAYLEDIVLRVALAASHPHFRGLRRHRTVGEHADPELSCLRSCAREHLACRFNLVAREARGRERLEPVGAEGNRRAARVRTIEAHLRETLGLPLTMFYFLRE